MNLEQIVLSQVDEPAQKSCIYKVAQTAAKIQHQKEKL